MSSGPVSTPFSRPRTSAVRIVAFVVISSLTIGAPHLVLAANLTRLNSLVPGYVSSVSIKDMPTADFDGDGLAEIVLLGDTNNSDVIQIAGFQPGSGWTIKQALVPETPANAYSNATIATWTDAGETHLLYARDNLVSVYSGWPLALERQIQFAYGTDFNDVKVADVDNDGVFEMLATDRGSSAGFSAYSLSNGAMLWSAPTPTGYYATLHFGQMDGDPALEIFVTGSPGIIVDGATRAMEWQYKDGFSPLLEHGRFGGTSNRFASLDDRLLMFQSQPWSPLWDMQNINARTSAVADVDGDGTDELIVGTESFPRGVRIIDVQAQSIRSAYEVPNILRIAAADFDGDSQNEIAVSLEAFSPLYEIDRFRIIDASTGASEFSIPATAPGRYLAGGFIPDAGNVDLVFGSASTTEFPGTIARVDASTGSMRWRISGSDPSIGINQVADLLTTDMAGQAHPVVLAFGTSYSSYYGRIVALDASNGSFLWSISSANGTLPDYVSVKGMAVADLDGDTLTDSLLLCTSEPRLRVYDTSTQVQTWSSVAMTGECRGAMQLNSGGHQQLVAILSGALRAYDAETHLLSWSLPFPNGMTGATYLSHGASGPELALFNGYQIFFYDAESRILLRELNFSDQYPLQAVAQPSGASIHDLAVAINGKLHIVDGITGESRATSEPLGGNAGQGNHLAVHDNPDGSALIGLGSDVAVFTHRLDGFVDDLFADGFELVPLPTAIGGNQ